jgi:hypothetical protein
MNSAHWFVPLTLHRSPCLHASSCVRTTCTRRNESERQRLRQRMSEREREKERERERERECVCVCEREIDGNTDL